MAGEYEILKLLVLIFGVSGLVVLLLHRLNIPPLVGFIISGVLIGPSGLGLAGNTKDIEILAEVGVVLLLFVIGIEFSLENLMKMRKAIFRGGSAQFILATTLAAIIAYPVLGGLKQSLFFGFLVALSSTAIVLKMLSERGELDSPQGRIILGILIFQDLIVVPLMLITPELGSKGVDYFQLSGKVCKAAVIIFLALLTARWLVPRFLHQAVHVKSRELFITTIILLCLGTALLTSHFGLSLALGAFLAGLVISESEYAHQAMSDILPFKDSLIGLFFVSMGMLMDARYMMDEWVKVVAAVVLILIVKAVTSAIAAFIAGTSLRPALLAGISLAQIGEFSFVLAGTGRAAGLIVGDIYQLFLAASLVTMLLTPFLINAAPRAITWVSSHLTSKRWRGFLSAADSRVYSISKTGQVIIVGFGLNGRNLARVLRQTDISYSILEINRDTVREMKRKREPIHYGDGTSAAILNKLGLGNAKVLVVAISDAAATRRILQIAREVNPDLHIIVRTRYVAEVDDLKKLGANEVIPEEFETSIEIFSKVLDYFSLPRNVINDYIDSVRRDNYGVLRKIDVPPKRLSERADILKGIDTDSYLVKQDSQLSGRTIKDTRLRAATGGTILAVERDGVVHQNPPPDFTLKGGDVLHLIGTKSNLHQAIAYLQERGFPTIGFDQEV